MVRNAAQGSKLSSLPRACPMCRQNFIVDKCESNKNDDAHEDKCDSSSGSIVTDYPSSQSSASDEEMCDDHPSIENLNA